MTTATILSRDGISGEESASVCARSRIYALFSRTFSFPEDRLHLEIRENRWLQDLTTACAGLPYHFRIPQSLRWDVHADYDVFQSGYIRLFEVGGRAGPPCPLHSGHYGQDRLRTMEELVRFFSFFGVRIRAGLMPDHASVELEFMHYLSRQEAEAEDEEERLSCLRAQRDFLNRQLAGWWPALTARVKRERGGGAFYRSAVSLAGRFLEAERVYLSRQISDS
ncbi:MAG: molecular chaperone TorD family protein [Dehalococcoidia bacterium]|nr:molecular chaperone TorD family protein [Dehalococcoidia bacterium]